MPTVVFFIPSRPLHHIHARGVAADAPRGEEAAEACVGEIE
jgi:hypothetical protein